MFQQNITKEYIIIYKECWAINVNSEQIEVEWLLAEFVWGFMKQWELAMDLKELLELDSSINGLSRQGDTL